MILRQDVISHLGEKLGEIVVESGLTLVDGIGLHQHQPFESTGTDYTETPIKPTYYNIIEFLNFIKRYLNVLCFIIFYC